MIEVIVVAVVIVAAAVGVVRFEQHGPSRQDRLEKKLDDIVSELRAIRRAIQTSRLGD